MNVSEISSFNQQLLRTAKFVVRPFFNVWRRFKTWFVLNNWFAGRIVELLGNEGKVGELKFDLSNPHIATFLKCRFLFQTYENGAKAVSMLHRFVNPELPVVEFGGCIGVMSCIANRTLKSPSDHVVVEGQPYLIETLKKNRDRNNCRFEVIHAALAYGSDRVKFWINPRYFVGNRTATGKSGEVVDVPAITLKQIVEERGYERITLMVDIEGDETNLVDQELELMRRVVETLVIELHPAEWGAGKIAIERLKNALSDAGFVEADRVHNDYVFTNSNIGE